MNSRSTSWADSDAVGSSRIRTPRLDRQGLGDLDQLLVGHRQAADRRARRRTGRRAPRTAPAAARRVAPQSIVPSRPDGAWPMNTFSATRQVREQARLLVDDRDPERAGLGRAVRSAIGSPSSRIVPLSGWWTPARILTSVLLPAPFSPTSAWTSPARRSSETSSSAWVAPNRFEIAAQLGARRRGRRRGRDGVGRSSRVAVAPVGRRGGIRGRRRSDEPDVDAARPQRRRPSPPGRRRRSGRRRSRSVGQNVANAARSHFVWSTIAMTSRAAATIERLIWASSSVASLRPGLEREAGGAEERLLDVDPARTARRRAGRRPTAPPSGRGRRASATVIPGGRRAPTAIRRPLVMTVSWLQPPRALRCRATARAVVLASMTMLSPSLDQRGGRRADPRLLVRWSRSRMSNASSGRLRSAAIAPPWVRDERGRSASRATRSLRIVTAGDAEPRRRGRATRARPCSSTMRAMCSWRSRAKTSPRGAGRDRSHERSPLGRGCGDAGVSGRCRTAPYRSECNVKKAD